MFNAIRHVSDDKKIALLFFAILSFNIFTLLINTLFNFFLPGTPLDTAFCLAILGCILLNALPAILRRLKSAEVLVALLAVLLFLLNYLIIPKTRGYVSANIVGFFLRIFPLYFLGRCITNYGETMRILNKFSIYAILAGAIYYLITNIFELAVSSDNMSFAYYYLPFVLVEIYQIFLKKSWINVVFSILGTSILLVCGTRGPFLCIGVFLLLFCLFLLKNVKIKILMVLFSLLIVLASIFGVITSMLSWLNSWMKSIGWESRILDKVISEDLSDLSGREDIYEKVYAFIQEHYLGYGLYADRLPLNGSYSHNFILEFTAFFGPLGFLLSIYLLVVTLAKICFEKIDGEYKVLLLLIFCCSIVKLFVSSSIISEPMFYLLLGLLFRKKSYNRNKQKIVFATLEAENSFAHYQGKT